ncbi:MAG TPA: hypothetical protein VGI39_39030 [Polyangiaceae bacterium]|jgi:phage tail sheath gpL-like
MPASIQLTGLASNDPVPGTYLQIQFAAGPAGGYQGNRPILLIGNKSSAGTMTPDTVVYGPDIQGAQCQTEQDVIGLAGPGSELHRGWRKLTQYNKTTSVYLLAVTASGGASATMVFTLANVPTSGGTLRIFGADEFVETGYNASDTLASITAAAVLNINSRSWLPFAASQTTVSTSNDSVTLTAKVPGPRGNWLRGMAQILPPAGIVSNMTVTNTADAFFTGGTTADSNTTALGTINPKRYYYLVSAAEDSTQFGALAAQVSSQALPTNGIRQRAFCGSVDSSGNVTTLATTVNNPRAEFVWSQACPYTPFEIACVAAGLYALYENSGSKPKLNWSGYGQGPNDTWPIPPSRDTTKQPTRTTIKGLLQNGVTPVGWSSATKTYLVKRITSYSLNGSVPDYRVRDAGKVTVCDFFGDDLYSLTNTNWSQKVFAQDPKPGSPPPDSSTITPNLYRGDVFNLIDLYGQSNLFKNVADIKAGTIVQQDPNNNNRIDVESPLQPVDIIDQFAVLLLQVA